jgi:uncharacterized protein YaiE (UPF0345 family)
MPQPDYCVINKSWSRSWVVLTFLFLAIIPSFAQISVSFPTSRIVFQRSKENTASFVVAGSYKQGIPDRVEASLEPVIAGQGIATGWVLVESQPPGGIFSGKISATGGWYKLRIRAIRNGHAAEVAEVDRVGIGEVFVVAGQSNARGIQNYGAPAANDDRVSCFNYLNVGFEPNELPEPSFSHLDADSFIAPYGYSAWAWGVLGDLLVAKLNVPVLFFNAALEGTTSRAWRESTTGSATNPYIGGLYANQLPYSQLRVSLKQFTSLTGIRAVLWHQGEADNQFDVPESEIVSNLQQLINQSRNDSGHNLSWVMARASYNNGTAKPAVVNAQNTVIGTVNNVFLGPTTDDIQIPRPDGVHIQGYELTRLAGVWNNSLNEAFFRNSLPRGPLPIPTFKVGCTGEENQIKLIAQSDYPETNWNIGGSYQSLTVTKGFYRLRAKDVSGNFLYSPTVEITENTVQTLPRPALPIITASGATNFCEGKSVKLSTREASAYKWNNGATVQTLNVAESNKFTVQIKDENGCWSLPSAEVATVVNPIPATPKIIAKGDLTFCADKTLILEIEGGSLLSTTNTLEWNSGQTTASIEVKQTGRYSVRTANQYNCLSAFSESVGVVVHPLPVTPVVTPSGTVRFCEKEAMTLYSNTNVSAIWSNGETTPNILIRDSGKYSVRSISAEGCVSSPSEVVVAEVSPTPKQPEIEQIGNYILKVKGDYLPNIRFRWSAGTEELTTSENSFKADKTARYTVSAFYFIDQTKTCASSSSTEYDFVLDLSGNGLNIYPNPSPDGVFKLESFDDMKNVRLQVVNLEGKLAYEQQVPILVNFQSIILPKLPPGVYVLKVASESHATIQKKLWVLP